MADKSTKRPRYLSYPANSQPDNGSSSSHHQGGARGGGVGQPPFGVPPPPPPGSGHRVKSQPDVTVQILSEKSGGSSANNLGNESPESGSLYSDEIPSGYNSGEQYDTISTGYMSGEAYELPETRMDLANREPALDVIEECHPQQSSSDKCDDSEDNMFKVPVVTVATPTAAAKLQAEMMNDEDVSSTSSCPDNMMGGVNEDMESILNNTSPTSYGGKKLHRKKVTTFAIPIEASPLNTDDYEAEMHEPYDESSDPGMGDAPTGGYRAVPSDTDTSAIDSDPLAVMGADDSGNLMMGRHKRRKKKNLKNHDEAWFNSHDTKAWSVARIVCFWSAVVSMLIATIVAAVMIATMPRNCDPVSDWYQGKVAIDVVPKPGATLNVQTIIDNLKTYKERGIKTLHLKHVDIDVPTSKFLNKSDTILENPGDAILRNLTASLHDLNMTLMIRIPVREDNENAKPERISMELKHQVELSIKFWAEKGADGIFLQGLENFDWQGDWVVKDVSRWKDALEQYGQHTTNTRILMTSYKLVEKLSDNGLPVDEALRYISLLDANIVLDSGNVTVISSSLDEVAEWDAHETRPWINWNFKMSKDANESIRNAEAAFQMLLPGTINLGYDAADLNQSTLHDMTSLRAVAVPIYMNGNYKRCDCEAGTEKEPNYHLRQPIEAIFQLERFYSRRHRYVLVANFGTEEARLESIGRIYAGGVVVLDTTHRLPLETQIKFNELTLSSGEAIVIKLPK